MPGLKLAKLPDRTPVKITITVPPELNQALRQYAGLYRATYGNAESVADLIPFMLGNFIENDRGFAKARKENAFGQPPDEPARRARRARTAPSSTTTGES